MIRVEVHASQGRLFSTMNVCSCGRMGETDKKKKFKTVAIQSRNDLDDLDDFGDGDGVVGS
jgi:hypothetical protein